MIECADNWFNFNNATPDYYNDCGGMTFANVPPPVGYPDGQACTGLVYEPGWNEFLHTNSTNPMDVNQMYFFSAYLGFNEDNTTWPVAHPFDLAIWGAIDVPPNAPGTDCPGAQWDLLSTLTYNFSGDQGWVFNQSDCFMPARPYNRFAIGSLCPAPRTYVFLDLVQLRECGDKIEIEVDIVITPACDGDSQPGGGIDLTVRNGFPPYTFDWDNDGTGDFDDPEDLTDVTSGTYTVIVRDAQGNERCLEVTIPEYEPVTPTFNQLGPYCETDPVVTLPTTSTNGIEGTWDPPEVDPSTDGPLFTSTFTPQTDECSEQVTMEIVIDTTLTPHFDPIGPLCETDIRIFLPTTSNDGIVGSWDPPDVNPATDGPVFKSIFTPLAFECADTTSMTITINSVVTPTFDPIDPFCELDDEFVLPVPSNNGIDGYWFPPTVNPATDGPLLIATFHPAPDACSEKIQIEIQIDSAVVPQLDPLGPFCEDDLFAVLPFRQDGIIGVWTGTGVNSFGDEFEPPVAGVGTHTLTFTPDDGQCARPATIDVLVEDCDNCLLTDIGLDQVICDDNTSPQDSTDDIIRFRLNPSGIDLSNSYFVTVSSGMVSPNSAPYGSPTNFQLNTGSAGSGNIFITVRDSLDPDCTITLELIDPGNCSGVNCQIVSAGLDSLRCVDNATPADSTDDYLRFVLNPFGNASSGSYIVQVSSGTITPNTGSFGMPTSFRLQNGSAGAGDVTITLIDANDVQCRLSIELMDPGHCSDASCQLDNAGLQQIRCLDNGTSADNSDDIIAFVLDPTGALLGTNYNVSVSSGTIAPTTAAYGAPTSFQLQAGSASAGNVIITITDASNPNCSIDIELLDPGSCSDDACQLSNPGLDRVICLDNGTSSDNTDDAIQFELNPIGTLLGTTYNITVSSGTVMPTSGSYGIATVFRLQNGSAGGGNLFITITDASDPNCTIAIELADPGTCSDDVCQLDDPGQIPASCSDNGTPSDNSDDILEFVLNPTGNLLSTSYQLSANTGTITPNTANYGMPTTFQLQSGSAGAGNVIITITDATDSNCSVSFQLLDPGSCSALCPTTVQHISETLCRGDFLTIAGVRFDASHLADSILLAAANEQGCDSIIVVNIELLEPTFSIIDDTLCNNQSITINGNIYDQNHPTGQELLRNDAGCDSTINVALNFRALDVEYQSIAPACIDATGTIRITQVSPQSNNLSYSVDGSDYISLPQDKLIRGLLPGSYSLNIRNESNCSWQSEITIDQGHEVFVDLGSDIEISPGDHVSIQIITNIDPDTIIWDKPERIECTQCLLTSAFLDPSPGLTTLQVTVIDDQGCSATDYLRIRVIFDRNVYIPNAITPNHDGSNDYFGIYGNPDEVKQVKRILIFDRWGNGVIQRTNLPILQSRTIWDGTLNGRAVDPAVFVYFAEIEFVDGITRLYKGDFTIIR